jgi:uncharacterized membrane protein YphA (DoxX/SURF4 family)
MIQRFSSLPSAEQFRPARDWLRVRPLAERLALPSDRLLMLRVALPLALLAGILLSPKLWLSSRDFPVAPLAELFPELESPLDALVFAVLIAALVLTVIARLPRPFLGLIVVTLVLMVLLDQTRLQPWVYQYLFMFGALALVAGRGSGPDSDAALRTVRLIVAATYVWSGAQKLNVSFADEIFPWFAEPFVDVLPFISTGDLPTWLGVFAAVVELGLGAGLLWSRTRRLAVAGLILMHVLILISLVSHNWNSVIWPWNVAMPLFLVMLFWGTGGWHRRAPGGRWRTRIRIRRLGSQLFGEGMARSQRTLYLSVVMLFAVLPLLSFFGGWESFLSSSLYSGNIQRATIIVDGEVAELLPTGVQDELRPGPEGRASLSVSDWALSDLNVPPYPEPRVFHAIAERVCDYADGAGEVELIIVDTPGVFSGDRGVNGFTCDDL